MQKLIPILKAAALGTVPVLGGFLMWALWPVHGTIVEVHGTVSEVHQGVGDARQAIGGVRPQLSAWLQAASARIDTSLGNVDRQVAAVGPVVQRANPVLDNLASDEAKAGQSIDRVNAPCPAKDADKLHPCGTLADVAKTLNTFRLTTGQIEIAANHEDKNLSHLDQQEDQLFEDFHGTATRANTSLDLFNMLLANPNVAVMIDNGGEFTTTAVAVEKKLAQCTLHPTFGCVVKSDIIFGAQVGGYLLH
jgi:hypothetical protein